MQDHLDFIEQAPPGFARLAGWQQLPRREADQRVEQGRAGGQSGRVELQMGPGRRDAERRKGVQQGRDGLEEAGLFVGAQRQAGRIVDADALLVHQQGHMGVTGFAPTQ